MSLWQCHTASSLYACIIMHHTVQAVTTYTLYNALVCTTEWAGRVNTDTQMAACIMANGMNMAIAMDTATWHSLMATTTGVSLTMGCMVALGSWSSRMGQGYCFFLFITCSFKLMSFSGHCLILLWKTFNENTACALIYIQALLWCVGFLLLFLLVEIKKRKKIDVLLS